MMGNVSLPLVAAAAVGLPVLLAVGKVIAMKIRSDRYYGTKAKNVPKDLAVLITGCDQGIGRITAEKMDSLGIRVFAGCLTEAGAQSLKASCSSKMTTFILDITKDEDVARCVELVNNECPEGIFCLVNNAGVRRGALFDWNDLSFLRKEIEVNYLGPARMIKAFIPNLIQTQGRVINIGSIASCVPVSYNSGYTGSKHAIYGLTSTLQLEFAPFNIDFITITPTAMKTSIVQEQTTEFEQIWAKSSPEIKERYGQNFYEYLLKIFQDSSPNSEPPTLVADAVIHACTCKKAKNFYPVGKGSWILTTFPFLFRMLFIPEVAPKAAYNL